MSPNPSLSAENHHVVEAASLYHVEGFEVALEPVEDHLQVASEWLALQARASFSFFISWGWIQCWLASLPSSMRPWLLRIRNQEAQTVGLGLWCGSYSWRHTIIPVRALHLHQTGLEYFDCIAAERNGLLIERGLGARVVTAVCHALPYLCPRIDEFCFSAVDAHGLSLAGLEGEHENNLRLERREVSPYIDFELLRSQGMQYLDSLSSNTRYQIKQTMKHYGDLPSIDLRVAESISEALAIFSELEQLHEMHWQKRGLSGAFSRPYFKAFHHRLIEERFQQGEIQLLRIFQGARTIGCLYNFLHEAEVYCYQSGFNYENKKYQPGLLSHSVAAQYYLERGAKHYDFLAGTSRYKESLSNESYDVQWLKLQRPRLKFALENGARLLHRWHKNLNKKRNAE